MIRSLRLANFKSFIETKMIRLTPITLLSGTNSSGKSTILQSLLVLKQSLESPLDDEPILLNGAYVSLGEFNDILNRYAKSKDINIDVVFGHLNKVQTKLDFPMLSFNPEKYFEDISLEATISGTNAGKFPTLKRMKLKGEVGSASFNIFIKDQRNIERSLGTQYNITNLENINLKTLYRMSSKGLSKKPKAVILKNFLPNIFFIPKKRNLINAQEEFMQSIIILLSEVVGYKNNSSVFSKPNFWYRQFQQLARRVNRQKNEFLNQDDNCNFAELKEDFRKIMSDYDNWRIVTIDDVADFLSSAMMLMDNNQINKVKTLLDDTLEKVAQLRCEKDILEPLHLRNIGISHEDLEVPDFEDVSLSLKSMFSKIYYLGPLRDEPKTFYRRLGSADPMNVGQRGENVAFVLKYYADKEIEAILPLADEEWNPYDSKIETCSLITAVERWLQYLGVAKSVKSEERGKVGLALKANIWDGCEDDLNNVGVGVSQVLPLVVMGLTAPADNSVLLFEQPELHLHPFVQSRLGDFFTALAAQGKQVIAETHSEHLILRIRYHIAKGNLSNLEDVSVYFCKHKEKESEIEAVSIDSFGAMDRVPEGFFDETQKLLKNILKAAISRH